MSGGLIRKVNSGLFGGEVDILDSGLWVATLLFADITLASWLYRSRLLRRESLLIDVDNGYKQQTMVVSDESKFPSYSRLPIMA
jgi:hypothetical protein